MRDGDSVVWTDDFQHPSRKALLKEVVFQGQGMVWVF